MDIEKLNLSVRAYNAFKRAGVNTVEDYINNPDKDKLNDVIGNKAVNEFLVASGQKQIMKYDATSMTQYHGSVAAGISRMCRRNKTAMGLVNDGSPAPLRDYLKKTYKYNGGGDSDLSYWGDPSKVTIKFDGKSVILSWSQVAKFIRDNPSEIFDDYSNSISPAPDAQSDNAVTVFNYSLLDADTARGLKDCERVIRTETSGYFTLLGARFKEAQGLLANHASGTFEQWYASMGFKRQTVYNLIQRYDFSCSPTVGGREEIFEELPLTLSYEISKPDAPAELVDRVLDGNITSNAEYKKLKSELERTKVSLHNLETNFDEREKLRFKEHEENAELKKQLEAAEKQVMELESRPIDVAVQCNESVIAEKDREISELKDRIDRLSDANIKSFVLRMTFDEYERLTEIIKNSEDLVIQHIVQNARLIKI